MNIRKLRSLTVILCATAFVFNTNVLAQQDQTKITESINQTNDKIEKMRAQVQEIEVKKAALQDRVRQLDEAMLPENLEQTTVTAGSTRPEELRENRRLQLETEKKGVQSQIDLLEQSRLRIETSIATTAPKPVPTETTPVKVQNTENASQTTQTETSTSTINSQTITAGKPQNSPPKRNRAKLKRKRIVKNS